MLFYGYFYYLKRDCRFSLGIEKQLSVHNLFMQNRENEERVDLNHIAPKEYDESERYYKSYMEKDRNAK